jgi:hypothetical protein
MVSGLDRRRVALLAAVSTNAAPLVGVVALDWSVIALLTVYWIDLGASLGFATVRGALAQRPPEYESEALLIGALSHKRGGIPVPFLPPSIQVANLPVLLVTLPVLSLVWLFVGGIAVGGVVETTAGGTVSDRVASSVAVGILGVVVGRGVETLVEYVGRGRYAEVSVQRALLSAAWPFFVTGGAMIASGLTVVAGTPPVVALVAIVVTKGVFDLGELYTDRITAAVEESRFDLWITSEPPAWPSFDETLPQPVVTVRPRKTALLLDGIVRGVFSRLCVFLVSPGLLFGLLGVATDNPELVALVGRATVVAVLASAVVGILDRVVRYGTMTYRVNGDVVGYDRLFRQPQWRVTAARLADGERTRGRIDRLFDTETVVVEQAERTIRLPHVPRESVLTAENESDSSGTEST